MCFLNPLFIHEVIQILRKLADRKGFLAAGRLSVPSGIQSDHPISVLKILILMFKIISVFPIAMKQDEWESLSAFSKI